MPDTIICLQCGGAVDDSPNSEGGEGCCTCSRPAVEAPTVSCPSCGGALRVGARACPFCGSTLATRRCPGCLAWNLAGAQHCQACGHILADHTHEVSTRLDLHCPRCDARLYARKYAELDVDECDQCGGLLLSSKMLDSIVASRDAPTGLQLALPRRTCSRETTVRYVRCPHCSNTMNRQMFGRISGVIVDVCRDHGVWFDAGELNEVLSWIEKGGLSMARQREKEDLAEQVRSLRSQQVAATTALPREEGHSLYSSSFGSDIVAAFVELWHGLR